MSCKTLVSLLVGLAWLLSNGFQARAQGILGQGGVTFEAVAGEPFGVARLVLPPDGQAAQALLTNNLAIDERDGRVLYPVFTTGRFRKFLGEVLGIGDLGGQALTVMFLFRGEEPLHLTLRTPDPRELRLSLPPERPRQRERLLNQWWREYTLVASQQLKDSDYPPVVHTYLTTMLSRRMGLPLPNTPEFRETMPRRDAPSAEYAKESVQLLLALEKTRLSVLRESFMDPAGYRAPANLPLPPEINWGPPAPVGFDPDVKIEPLAERVPEEFFYIRFGRLANQTWLDKLTAEHGGAIANMVTLRGLDDGAGARLETQLALPPPLNVVEEVVGDAMIEDVALVGRDLYLEDGAAIGMLFQMRTQLFATNLNTHRREVVELEKERGATLTTVRIADRDVSFLATPDNRLRSFMAQDGNFLLVTSSRAMVERFYATGRGEGRLADQPEFKHARSEFPLSREDTIFAYFSPAFFRGLLSIQYQIEVGRRLRSHADMQLIQLARQAAAAEGIDDAPASLIAAGLAPPGFGKRPDGGGWEVVDGRALDTLRGAPGTFLPVPDVPLTGATRAEVDACLRRAAFYESRWKQMDPLMVAIKRTPEDGNRERIIVDARVAPLEESKYGWFLSIIGLPTQQRIEPGEDDVIFAQAFLKGGLLDGNVQPHHLFVGIKDARPVQNAQLGDGLFETLRTLRTTPGYIGGWPKPGFLDWLPFNLGGTIPDAQGYSRLPLGIWRRQWDAFSVVALDPQVLEPLPAQLQMVPTEEVAQVRIRVKDLSQALLAEWVNSLQYERARKSSVGNVKLLHMLRQQLHVPLEETRQVAETLLNARLLCPLGGQYELRETGEGTLGWYSTAWQRAADRLEEADERDPLPPYASPLLKWFRGADAYLVKQPEHLVMHADLRLERLPPPPAPPSKPDAGGAKPLFNFNIFGSAKPKPDKPGEVADPKAEQQPDAKEKPEAAKAAPAKVAPEALPPPKPGDTPRKKRDF